MTPKKKRKHTSCVFIKPKHTRCLRSVSRCVQSAHSFLPQHVLQSSVRSVYLFCFSLSACGVCTASHSVCSNRSAKRNKYEVSWHARGCSLAMFCARCGSGRQTLLCYAIWPRAMLIPFYFIFAFLLSFLLCMTEWNYPQDRLCDRQAFYNFSSLCIHVIQIYQFA